MFEKLIREYILTRGGIDELALPEKKVLVEMRSDMSKVVITRPRVGGTRWEKRRRYKNVTKHASMHDENFSSPKRESMKAPWRKDPKDLSDFLAPLKRYLLKQKGRKWDDVWSDISKNLKATSVTQQHVRDHVEDFVALKVVMKDGKPFETKYNTYVEGSGNLLWVDPKTDILKLNDQRSYKADIIKKRNLEKRKVAARKVEHPKNKNIQYHKLKGQWWEVTLAPGDTYDDVIMTSSLAPKDLAMKKGLWGLTDRPQYKVDNFYERRGLIATKKKQISARDAKKLGLK